MANRLKFPIRYKILAVLSVVVVAAVAFYLYLAAKLFYEDKTVLIYELNQNNVRTLASDVTSDIRRVFDKLKLISGLVSESSRNPEIFSSLFADEDELVRVVVLKQDGERQEILFSHVWPKYLDVYKSTQADLDRIRLSFPIQFQKTQELGMWVKNSTLPDPNSAPLFTVAVPTSANTLIYADVRADRLLESFSSGGIAKTYAVDSEGFLLAGSDQQLARQAKDLTQDPLVRVARESKVKSEVRRYDENGHTFLGSYAQVSLGGVVVVSKVEAEAAFAAAERLVRKSLVYALVVVTAAFLIALFFSHSLTEPIQTLLEATQRIAKGDFGQPITVASRDELAALAQSFNSMTVDLKSSRAQIEEYSRDLEQKVHDRTVELERQNVAIKETQEALVRTTRLASVGEVAGRAAHEVLNPLTNLTARLEKMQQQLMKADHDDLKLLRDILQAWRTDYSSKNPKSFVESLLSASTAKPGKTLLEEDLENLTAIQSDLDQRLESRNSDIAFLHREAARINKIVNSMRQLTRVSAVRRPIAIHEVLNETVATMRDVLAKRHIQTESLYCSANPIVLADHDELLQVFSNLIRNSMQAIDDAQRLLRTDPNADVKIGSPPKVWFSTQLKTVDEGRRVFIRIHDNGPGIQDKDQSKVFESSFTTKSVEEGTGLGLSIARRFIRALDGEITVEKSVPGVETVFLIELPEQKPRDNG